MRARDLARIGKRFNGQAWSATILITLVTALLVAGLAACTPTVIPPVEPSRALPPQGLYEECSPTYGQRCLTRLSQMAGAGFALVLNYGQLFGTATQEYLYAARANALGMKIIWAMNDPAFWNGTDLRRRYHELASTCACTDNTGFTRYVVSLAKGFPATWGYYVGDEVQTSNHTRMKAFSDLVHRLDPTHPRLYIGNGNFAEDGATVAPFTDTAEVLGADYYPVGDSQSVTAVARLARSIQSIVDRHGKGSAMVLQAFSWSEYDPPPRACSRFPVCARFPTKAEIRLMRDLVLQSAHPQFILWYSFFDLFRTTETAAHWPDLLSGAGP